MNRKTVFILLLVVAVPIASLEIAMAEAAESSSTSSDEGKWVCPPCDPDHDGEAYENPGQCPICGMKLVRKKEIRNVGILIFDGVQIIDFTGPYEVFGQGPFNVFTVSEKPDPITTAMEMRVTPSYEFANSPEPDILIIPGGHVDEQVNNPRVQDWIRDKAEAADYVLTVCNGAFILAKTGLLDGLTATTFYGLIDELETFAPNVKVVRDQRYVDNGKIITSAGLSSGIDASLYLTSKIRGRGSAQALALHLEYDWKPDSQFARAALADRLLPELSEPEGAEARVVSTTGNRDRWETRYAVETGLSLDEITTHLEREISQDDRWKKIDSQRSEASARSEWGFEDKQGRGWRGETLVEASEGLDYPLLVTLRIFRLDGQGGSFD